MEKRFTLVNRNCCRFCQIHACDFCRIQGVGQNPGGRARWALFQCHQDIHSEDFSLCAMAESGLKNRWMRPWHAYKASQARLCSSTALLWSSLASRHGISRLPAEGEEAWGPALPNPGTGTRATASVPHTVHCPGDRWNISFFLLSESNTQAEGSFS